MAGQWDGRTNGRGDRVVLEINKLGKGHLTIFFIVPIYINQTCCFPKKF